MKVPDDILRELSFQAGRRSTLELEEILSRVVEKSLEEMGSAAVEPLSRARRLPDRTLEEIVFKNKAFPEDLPDKIRRIVRTPLR